MRKIAAIQMELDVEYYRSGTALYQKVLRLAEHTRKQAGSGDLLIVFPEHVGTFAVLCGENRTIYQSTTLATGLNRVIKAHLLPVLYQRIRHRTGWMRAVTMLKARQIREAYFSTFSAVAKQTNAWIVAGSVVLPNETSGELTNDSYLFDPQGEVIGKQSKINLVDMEGPNGLDVSSGELNKLQVFSSPFGKLGIAVCLDAFKQPVLDRLSELGAQLLIQPSANPGPWNDWQQQDWLSGAYQAVMEKGLFELAINPMLVGDLFDVRFEGQSSIISRGSTTLGGYLTLQNSPGFVEVAKTANKEEILLTTL